MRVKSSVYELLHAFFAKFFRFRTPISLAILTCLLLRCLRSWNIWLSGKECVLSDGAFSAVSLASNVFSSATSTLPNRRIFVSAIMAFVYTWFNLF